MALELTIKDLGVENTRLEGVRDNLAKERLDLAAGNKALQDKRADLEADNRKVIADQKELLDKQRDLRGKIDAAEQQLAAARAEKEAAQKVSLCLPLRSAVDQLTTSAYALAALRSVARLDPVDELVVKNLQWEPERVKKLKDAIVTTPMHYWKQGEYLRAAATEKREDIQNFVRREYLTAQALGGATQKHLDDFVQAQLPGYKGNVPPLTSFIITLDELLMSVGQQVARYPQASEFLAQWRTKWSPDDQTTVRLNLFFNAPIDPDVSTELKKGASYAKIDPKQLEALATEIMRHDDAHSAAEKFVERFASRIEAACR